MAYFECDIDLPFASTISISPDAGHVPYASLFGNNQIAVKKGMRGMFKQDSFIISTYFH
jgi:hypothetical protein